MAETTVRPTDREWIRTLEADPAALRKGLQGEVERLREEADAEEAYNACGEAGDLEGCRGHHPEMIAFRTAAGRLSALLDSGGEK
jgi:hypothetical protein